jgi:CRP-like cAMP-binding protein
VHFKEKLLMHFASRAAGGRFALEPIAGIALWLALALGCGALWATKMRPLRLLAMASGVVVLAASLLMSNLIAAGIALVMLILNAVQLSRLGGIGNSGDFTDDEKLMHDTVLPSLDTIEARRLMAQGEWRTALQGAELMQENQRMPELVYVARGAAVVEMGGKLVGVCGPGDFLGEMSFMSGQPASATVRVANKTSYCAFDRAQLSGFLDDNPELRSALEASFNRNLAGKLVRMNATASGKPMTLEDM